jgi:hypothetical protein
MPFAVWALSHLSIRYGRVSLWQNSGDEDWEATVPTRWSETACAAGIRLDFRIAWCDADELTRQNCPVARELFAACH